MAATKTELTGGSFQDSLGNPLASGYLTMHLSQDCSVSGVGTVCSGIDITVNLDANGNVVAGQYVWSNLVMSPQNNYYKVTGFTAAGQRAFGPNNQQVASGSTFNLDSWTPNTVISWFPATQPLLLEVNGAQASSQVVQDLVAGSGVTITDEGGGVIEFTASASIFEVNGTALDSSSVVNFVSGTGIAVSNPSAGEVLITNTLPGGFGGSNVANIPLFTGGASGLAGYSMILVIPASYITATGNSIQVGLSFYNVSSGAPAIINAASIGSTLPNPAPAIEGFTYNYNWSTAPVSITWPAGSFENPNQIYFSNPATIPVDVDHDYYVVVYIDSSSPGDSPYTGALSSGSMWANLGGYAFGNHTADADSSGLVGHSQGIFNIQQVVIA